MASFAKYAFFIYLGSGLLALIIAAFLPVPAIYYPAYIAGIFFIMAIIKLFALLLIKWRQDYASSALALTLALLALALTYFMGDYRWTSEAPEPVRLWPMWLAEWHGLAAAAAIFYALDAKSDKASAICAFILATLALFLMGYNGIETLTDKAAGLSVLCGVGILGVEKILTKVN